MAKDVSRHRQLARFWLRLVCFVLLAALAIGYATYVLTPKHDYGICRIPWMCSPWAPAWCTRE